MKRAESAAQSLECVRDDAYTRRASSQPVATIWLSVTSTDAPCSHLKRKRSPVSVARLIAGISTCRTGMVEKAKETPAAAQRRPPALAVP